MYFVRFLKISLEPPKLIDPNFGPSSGILSFCHACALRRLARAVPPVRRTHVVVHRDPGISCYTGVLFFEAFFTHNFAENDPQDLKMV
jgi:hypothetical protein